MTPLKLQALPSLEGLLPVPEGNQPQAKMGSLV